MELKEEVRVRGFKAKADNWHVISIEDEMGAVNFFVSVEYDYEKALKTNVVKGELSFRAAIRGCGGNPTADELKEIGERIVKAANLVNRLNRMNLRFTEEIGKE